MKDRLKDYCISKNKFVILSQDIFNWMKNNKEEVLNLHNELINISGNGRSICRLESAMDEISLDCSGDVNNNIGDL